MQKLVGIHKAIYKIVTSPLLMIKYIMSKTTETTQKESRSLLDRLYLSSIDHFVNYRRNFREYFWAILIALVLRSMVVTIYKIPTPSMVPTFRVGDMLIANRFFYGLKLPFTDGLEGFRLPSFKKPTVGSVIIFRAPPEEDFYKLKVRCLTPQALDILHDINSASSYKRPIWVSDGNTNNIFFSSHMHDGFQIHDIFLHHRIMKQYKSILHDSSNFQITQQTSKPYKLAMTYKEHLYQGVLRSVLDTPLAGVSILFSAAMNTPFMSLYRRLAYAVLEPQGFFLREENGFSIYPNRFVDMTKDYVKRVVGVEGDVIEIKDKELYINGSRIERSTMAEPDYEKSPSGQMVRVADMYREKLPLKDGKGFVDHPVRFTDNRYKQPPLPFQPDVWPYDPQLTSWCGIDFRDNFGPIIVPKDHFFALGDNRDNSSDSRYWGCVPAWAVKGTPMFIFLPFSRRGIIR